jgi:hypothetical protein
MDTPENTPAKSDKVAPASGFWEKAKKWVAVIGIIVVAMIYFGQKLMMGTRYKVTDKESVNYSEKATEADAKKLGDYLKTIGYFNGSSEKDVLLMMGGKEGTVVSFVINGLGPDDTIVTGFREVGEGIAKDVLSKPLKIRLMDTRLNTLKDIKVE